MHFLCMWVAMATYESERDRRLFLSLSLLDVTMATYLDESCWQSCERTLMFISLIRMRLEGERERRGTLGTLTDSFYSPDASFH